TSILSFISGRLATKSNQIKQLIRNGRSASLQRTFKKSFTSFSHSTRNKTRDGLIRVRNIRSEERFSRNAETDLVCSLLLEKKKDFRSPTCAPRSSALRPTVTGWSAGSGATARRSLPTAVGR